MRYLTAEIERLLAEEHKMCFIAGPRQVGKTTLVKHHLTLTKSPSEVFHAATETPSRCANRPDSRALQRFIYERRHPHRTLHAGTGSDVVGLSGVAFRAGLSYFDQPAIESRCTVTRGSKPMRIIEQHKLIQDLKGYLAKMSPSDRYDFEMFAKRDKDDEELDALSTTKLETMHKKYVVRKTKKDIEELFKKMASKSSDSGEKQ
jgi:energy-coupling factor transporter ATP-binding protein EcfA2